MLVSSQIATLTDTQTPPLPHPHMADRMITVTVTVLDVNDNPPTVTNDPLTASVDVLEV